jgi:hypothetical protein
MRLIVTDVEFASSYSNHQGAGMTGRVFIENRTTSTTRTIAALIPPGTGGQSGKASPGTGFSVSAGGRLVADALYSTGASYTISISSSYGYPQNVNDHHLFVLRGYLVTEE